MVHPEFEFRPSTEEEILIFSEEFSNECRLNPEVRFTTAVLQDENYAIFATREGGNETRILFFLIFEHPLKVEYTLYKLFCDFTKKMTHIEPAKENLGKSKRICWNLQDSKYHIFFDKIWKTEDINPPYLTSCSKWQLSSQ